MAVTEKLYTSLLLTSFDLNLDQGDAGSVVFPRADICQKQCYSWGEV